VVTVLVHLNDCIQGGQTDFAALNLQLSPRKGSAVVFFPATIDGYLDKRALHAALPAIETKYVFQVWVRQGTHTR
jgi:prolyl 4-hydroxylase